jgi:hypothetical protein
VELRHRSAGYSTFHTDALLAGNFDPEQLADLLQPRYLPLRFLEEGRASAVRN